MFLSPVISLSQSPLRSNPEPTLHCSVSSSPPAVTLLHQPPASARRNNSPPAHSNIWLPIDYRAGWGDIDFFQTQTEMEYIDVFEGLSECCGPEEMNQRNYMNSLKPLPSCAVLHVVLLKCSNQILHPGNNFLSCPFYCELCSNLLSKTNKQASLTLAGARVKNKSEELFIVTFPFSGNKWLFGWQERTRTQLTRHTSH